MVAIAAFAAGVCVTVLLALAGFQWWIAGCDDED